MESYYSILENAGAELLSEAPVCRIYRKNSRVFALYADKGDEGRVQCLDLLTGSAMPKEALLMVLGYKGGGEDREWKGVSGQTDPMTAASFYFELVPPEEGKLFCEMPLDASFGKLALLQDAAGRAAFKLESKGKASGWLYASEDGSAETRPPFAGGCARTGRKTGKKLLLCADPCAFARFFSDEIPDDWEAVLFSPYAGAGDIFRETAGASKARVLCGGTQASLAFRVRLAAVLAKRGGLDISTEISGNAARVLFYAGNGFSGIEASALVNVLKKRVYEALGCSSADDKKKLKDHFFSLKASGPLTETEFPLAEQTVSVFEKEMGKHYPEGTEITVSRPGEEEPEEAGQEAAGKIEWQFDEEDPFDI